MRMSIGPQSHASTSEKVTRNCHLPRVLKELYSLSGRAASPAVNHIRSAVPSQNHQELEEVPNTDSAVDHQNEDRSQ